MDNFSLPSQINIVHDEQDFIIVSKPANISFHDEGNVGQGLFSLVKKSIALDELYPVHRLDKMTSGLVIMAKTLECARWFQHAFEHHLIEKYYIALSSHKPIKKQGQIKGDMAKARRGMWKLLRSTNNPAITQFFSYSVKANLRLFVLKPYTGKTHQLRVALSSIGAAIAGDSLYESNNTADRGYLHAYGLRFIYQGRQLEYLLPPEDGELFQLNDCKSLLDNLKAPWQLEWPKKI
ncbi:TIGR01621 family pseudouridine synthase [Thalassotalea ganghwensis]